MLLDAVFSPRIVFFFSLKGGVVEGKTKNLFFFSAHYHPWIMYFLEYYCNASGNQISM